MVGDEDVGYDDRIDVGYDDANDRMSSATLAVCANRHDCAKVASVAEDIRSTCLASPGSEPVLATESTHVEPAS